MKVSKYKNKPLCYITAIIVTSIHHILGGNASRSRSAGQGRGNARGGRRGEGRGVARRGGGVRGRGRGWGSGGVRGGTGRGRGGGRRTNFVPAPFHGSRQIRTQTLHPHYSHLMSQLDHEFPLPAASSRSTSCPPSWMRTFLAKSWKRPTGITSSCLPV